MSNKLFLIFFFGVLILVGALVPMISAASILDELHLNIQTTDSGGNVITGNFNFVFNISTTSDCNSVIYSNSTSLTTDSRGIISYYLTNVDLSYDNQYYLCYYRNGVLINNSKISRSPYAFRAKYVNVSGIEVDSNLDLGGFNLSADYVFGDGRYLTNLNVSAINLSAYVPYTGADKNVNLGNNNFSVNGTTLFVNSNTGRVGIGTTTPTSKLVIDLDGTGKTLKFEEWAGAGTYATYGWGIVGSVDKLKLPSTVYFGDSSFYFQKSGNNGYFYAYNDLKFGSSNTTGGAKTYLYGQQSTGNVGIGTTTPQNKLNVIGDINATGLIYGDGSQLTNLNVSNIDLSAYVPYTGADKNLVLGDNNLSVGGTDFFVDNNLGRVGIGTWSPSQKLHVEGSVNITENISFGTGGNMYHNGTEFIIEY